MCEVKCTSCAVFARARKMNTKRFFWLARLRIISDSYAKAKAQKEGRAIVHSHHFILCIYNWCVSSDMYMILRVCVLCCRFILTLFDKDEKKIKPQKKYWGLYVLAYVGKITPKDTSYVFLMWYVRCDATYDVFGATGGRPPSPSLPRRDFFVVLLFYERQNSKGV